jgi:calcineurin-like phosphoesterase family protein
VPSPLFVVGDVHGHRDALVDLLRTAGLVDSTESWSGADARLRLVGDLVDRGPDGIGAIALVRRLERESGGRMQCLLGNHEALLLAVRRFAGEETSIPGESVYENWKLNGGVDRDLRELTADDAAWLTALPPLVREGDWLIVHADTTAYLELGRSIDDLARATSCMLAQGSVDDVDLLLQVLSDRMRLGDPDGIDALLGAYGGRRIVHGHTPIASVLGVDPHGVTGPLVYAGGLVWNVDHCLFAGGPGFVTRLDDGSGLQARPVSR